MLTLIKPQKMNGLKSICLLGFIFCMSSCVSKKQFLVLEEKVAELSSKGPSFNMTDEDGDGVFDMVDQEPNTPSGYPVDTRGIALDSDGDGFLDGEDQEPFSPVGFEVDQLGVAQVPDSGGISEEEVKRMIQERLPQVVASPTKGDDLINIDNLNFKEFTLPPPDYSKRDTFNISQVFTNPSTFGDINDELKIMLSKAGYVDSSEQPLFYYFQIKQDRRFKGYAIVTAIEQINKDGIPLSNRFDDTVRKKDPSGIWEWFVTPLNEGYFRFFAFLVTDDYYGGEKKENYTKVEATKEYSRGEKVLHKAIVGKPITPNCKLHVLVYEFFQREDAKDGSPNVMEGISVISHLNKANINID